MVVQIIDVMSTLAAVPLMQALSPLMLKSAGSMPILDVGSPKGNMAPCTISALLMPSTQPFVATSLTGFAFEISGDMVPSPTALRFKVEDASGEYCNIATKQVKKGANSFVFADLVKECWKPPTPPVTAEAAKAGIVKIAWQVVTNASSTVPFDFCVSNVRALQ